MNLKKKVGPLPMWAWVLIVGTTIGLLWYEHSKGSSSTSSTTSSTSAANQIDPATGMTYAEEAAYQANGIDPLTGQTYASEYGGGSASYGGGSGLTDTGSSTTTSYPSLSQEIADVTSAVQGLQSIGLFTPAPTAVSGSTQTAGPLPFFGAGGSNTGNGVQHALKHITDTLKGGAKITNFKPVVTKGTHVQGIGNGWYEETKIAHKAVAHPKKVTGGHKRAVTTNRVGGAHRVKG